MTSEEESRQETGSRRELVVTAGPHLRQGLSVNMMMYLTLVALAFPAAAGIFLFGYHALSVIFVSIGAAIATEVLVKKLRGRPFVMDGSGVITGLLLALLMPPTIPLWMVVVGAAFAIAIVREAFGGLGHNIFNPALGGLAFMSISFSTEMTTWVSPMGFGADIVKAATPLSDAFIWQGDNVSLYGALFLGDTSGAIGETSALFMLMGGALLILLRIIDWRVPLVFIGTVALFSLGTGEDVIFQTLAGGLMLGAFFLATDPVTTPITRKGRIIFAIGAGVIVGLIRNFGGQPEGVIYAILLMNAVSPLIDRYVTVKPPKLKEAVARNS
jgi:electron transport complex protein RnfD